jgi:hypothetical protein
VPPVAEAHPRRRHGRPSGRPAHPRRRLLQHGPAEPVAELAHAQRVVVVLPVILAPLADAAQRRRRRRPQQSVHARSSWLCVDDDYWHGRRERERWRAVGEQQASRAMVLYNGKEASGEDVVAVPCRFPFRLGIRPGVVALFLRWVRGYEQNNAFSRGVVLVCCGFCSSAAARRGGNILRTNGSDGV